VEGVSAAAAAVQVERLREPTLCAAETTGTGRGPLRDHGHQTEASNVDPWSGFEPAWKTVTLVGGHDGSKEGRILLDQGKLESQRRPDAMPAAALQGSDG